MPTVVFEGNLFGPTIQVDAAEGEKLVDLCDRTHAPVPFSCRAATCGTCRVEITEGADLLELPAGEEARLLAILEDPPEVRLACQAHLRRIPDVQNVPKADNPGETETDGEGPRAPVGGLIRIRLADNEI